MKIDKRIVGASFHKGASNYDNLASVQVRVINTLLEDIKNASDCRPERILDVGCGTGSLLCGVHLMFPSAGLYGLDLAHNMCILSRKKLPEHALVIRGDAEKLPFGEAGFDLVVSTSVFQWVPDIKACLNEMFRVIRPGGMFCLALFVEGTLTELQQSFREADDVCYGNSYRERRSRLHQFRSVAEISEILCELGLESLVLSCETETDWFENLRGLLGSIKGIGAGIKSEKNSGGLGWRKILDATSYVYQNKFSVNNMLPATYNVLYVRGKRAV